MTVRRVLMVMVAVVCLVAGFVTADYLDRLKYAREAAVVREASAQELVRVRGAGEAWAGTVAESQGVGVARAFAAGIAPALMSGRREQVASAGLGLLRVTGVLAIHVLGTDGGVLYSSDAKLSTTGEAGDRGSWAQSVTEPISEASARAGAHDIAVPITSSEGAKLAVVWLEFDAAGVREATRPPELQLPANGATEGDK